MAYKSSTQQTLQYIERIENYLKSENYKNQIGGQDIFTQSSPYRYNGEQTLGETIEIMKIAFEKIKGNIELYDKGNIDYRNNANNSLNTIVTELESNPIGNWQNIIQQINNVVMYIGYIGIYIGSESLKNKDIKALKNQLEKAETLINQTELVDKIIRKLQPISEKIPSPEIFENNLSEFNTKIININASYTDAERNKGIIDALRIDAETKVKDIGGILSSTASNEISQYFNTLSDSYKASVEGNWEQKIEGWKFWNWNLGLKGLFNWNIYFLIALATVIGSLYFIISHGQDSSNQKFVNSATGSNLEQNKVSIGFAINEFNTDFIEKIGAENITGSLIGLEIVKIISNGLIRFILMLPSILLLWFVLKNRDDKERLRKTYEFRANAIKTLSGQLEQLRQQDISPEKRSDFLTDILSKIYTEPDDLKKESEEGILEGLKKTADIMEKIKNTFGK